MPPGRDGQGIRFALLAPLTVQAVRFLSKVVLVWFLSTDEMGSAMLAGLLAFLGLHVALFGLDEATIYVRDLGPELWRRMRRFHHASGVLVSILLAVAGQLLGWLLDDPRLAALVTAVAPTVWLANLSVLPTALLVRRREFRSIFMVDVWSVGGFASITIALAALGAGPWSLVGGWYANAILAALTASRYARAFHPAAGEPGDPLRPTLRYGAHMTGASLLGFTGDRVDSFAVAFGLGQAALGLYEWALHLSLFVVNFATSLAERVLFPVFAEHHREQAMGPSYREALRLCMVFIMPLHVLLAVISQPLITAVFPEEWHAAAPLLAILSLAAGVRCLDMVGTTALKAAGRSRAVLTMALIRIALLCVAIFVGLTQGLHALAVGVLAARGIGVVLILIVAVRLCGIAVQTKRQLLASGGVTFAVWCAAFLGASMLRGRAFAENPLVDVAVTTTLAFSIWIIVRWLLNRSALLTEWKSLNTHLRSAVGRSAS